MLAALGRIGALILLLYALLATANFYEDLKKFREQQEADSVESVDSKGSEESKEPAGSLDSESSGEEKQPPEEDGEKRRLSGLDPKTWEN